MKIALTAASSAVLLLAGCNLPPPPGFPAFFGPRTSAPVVYDDGYEQNIPTSYRRVVIDNNDYYTDGGRYYSRDPRGYRVVERPRHYRAYRYY